jgi:hypothetical protein
MTATFTIHKNELNQALLEKLKAAFSSDEVRIIVTDADDDADYPYNNPAQREHLLQTIDDINKRQNLIPFDPKSFE